MEALRTKNQQKCWFFVWLDRIDEICYTLDRLKFGLLWLGSTFPNNASEGGFSDEQRNSVVCRGWAVLGERASSGTALFRKRDDDDGVDRGRHARGHAPRRFLAELRGGWIEGSRVRSSRRHRQRHRPPGFLPARGRIKRGTVGNFSSSPRLARPRSDWHCHRSAGLLQRSDHRRQAHRPRPRVRRDLVP